MTKLRSWPWWGQALLVLNICVIMMLIGLATSTPGIGVVAILASFMLWGFIFRGASTSRRDRS